MKSLSAMMMLAAGISLSAAGLPDGWKPYITGKPEDKAQCSVTAKDKNILIEDKSKLAEAGICRTFPVTAGKYYKFTLEYDYPTAKNGGMEVTAYCGGKRVGQSPVTAKGISVLKTIQIPQKNTSVTIFFYSGKTSLNTATLKSIKVETADQPFK